MSERGTQWRRSLQEAFIEVNEIGTEAAAATAIEIKAASRMGQLAQPKVFHADHPFPYLPRVWNVLARSCDRLALPPQPRGLR
jgi:serine protease inhibitor